MTSTKIRALREKKGLTQRQLAKVVGTSQQQIQRIETGVQAPRFDLAARICSALKTPMEQVFPTTKKPIAALRRKGLSAESIFRDNEFGAGMEAAGIDMDPAVWTFKLRLRGGAMKMFPVSGPEKNRLWSAVQDPTEFVVFDSSGETSRPELEPPSLLSVPV
jgi:DNA-binding XRE family transcriptional regulator